MVRSIRWINDFFGLSAKGVSSSCSWIYLHTPHNYTTTGFCASPWSSQKLSSAGGWSLFVNMFQFRLPFQTTVIKIPPSLCHPTSISLSVQNSYYLIWSNRLTVPQQFVLVCKLSNNMEDEKLSKYSLCPHFKFLQ